MAKKGDVVRLASDGMTISGATFRRGTVFIVSRVFHATAFGETHQMLCLANQNGDIVIPQIKISDVEIVDEL